MIGASRRRSNVGAQHSGSGFDLHLREARAAALHRRLLHASLVALAASVVALFIPVPLAVRAAIVAGGALLGALLPLRGGPAAALASIREQTGLSYETALALLARRPGEEPATDPDPYGFEGAVMERAHLSVRGYRSERRPPWWLPALVVAAALVALPELVRGAAPEGGGAPPTAAAPPTGSEDAPTPEPGPEPAPPQPPAPGRADAPAAPSGQEDGEEGAPISDLPDGDVAGDAPLSRYLESLRTRPATTDGAEADQAADADEAAQTEGQDDEASGETGPGDQQGEGGSDTQQEAGDGSSGEQSPSTAESGQDGSQAAEQFGEDGSSGAEGASPDDGAIEQGAQAGGEQPGSGEQGLEPTEGDDDTISSGGSGDPSDGPEGGGAGGVGGVPTTDETSGLGEEPGDLEMLSGVLQAGPESTAGSVRLPGSSEVDLPAGTSHAPYQSAAEEALSEGELPLDYQEIIRRYFR